MPQPSRPSLRDQALESSAPARFLADESGRVLLARLAAGTPLEGDLERFRNRSVLITTDAQLPTALAAIALDGIAARILLCPPDLRPDHLPAIITDAQVDLAVSDGTGLRVRDVPVVGCRRDLDRDAGAQPARKTDTEWVLFTSGTTGRPKMVRHTLPSLAGPMQGVPSMPDAVWSTFYDVRRYGGLAILMRALLGGTSMVLSSTRQSVGEFLQRAGAAGVTHLSGTPSHWRRALMSPAIGALAPRNVRLSGEIADQAILDRLRETFPQARVVHAFASTEAGVAFEVADGLAGFPAAVFAPGGPAEMRVEDGTLRIRSRRTAAGYVGTGFQTLDGFVDTGDMVERRGDRYVFVGRREGVINVGGQKVYPEEVEAVINQHEAVRMSRVWARSSPVTGEVVAADLVLTPEAAAFPMVRDAVLQACRDALPAYKVPVSVRQVSSLAIADSGKLVRRDA